VSKVSAALASRSWNNMAATNRDDDAGVAAAQRVRLPSLRC
jgi:hypothetical protein